MARNKEKNLELRVEPWGDSDYGITLYEQRPAADGKGKETEMTMVVRIWGLPFRAIADKVLEALKKSGYRAVDLQRGRKTPFILPENHGVRLGLLMLAAKPLKKHSRIESISGLVANMTDEEAYYWFSKCTTPDHGRRAQKALRILLAKE